LGIGILLHEYGGLVPWHFFVLAAMLFFPAVWAAGVTARIKQLKDPQIVVVDEVVGQWIALGGAHTLNWKSYLAALALFRLFDVWKPPPVRQLEALPGGLGINADDVMAGIYAALVLFAAGCFNLY
jgi:phosphatidylglycerophosphatase A